MLNVGFCKLQKPTLQSVGRRFLQVNTRWKALAEIYTMHSFAPFYNLNFFVKILHYFILFLPKKSQNFQNFATCKFLLNFDEIFSGFLRTFRSLPEVPRRYSGIGTNAAGRCIWPIHPLLASSCARPTAALRDKRRAGWANLGGAVQLRAGRNLSGLFEQPELLRKKTDVGKWRGASTVLDSVT